MTGDSSRRGSFPRPGAPFRAGSGDPAASGRSAAPGEEPIDPLIAPSRVIRELKERIERVAPSRVPVLIEAESGCGREGVARRIHDLSPRARAPFESVDCSAIPEPLLPRELFGHRRGAFTGAERDDPGRLRAAAGGSVYLHGVDRLPPTGQAALLRVLEQGEVLPIGAHRPERVDLRFIESADRSLAGEVRAGAFRSDLFHRLCGLQLAIPPLRERPEDVAFHLEWSLRRGARRLGRAVPRLREDLRRLLLADPWPGNILELEHAVEGMLALATTDLLTPADLPPSLLERLEERGEAPTGTRTFSIPASLGFADQVAYFQRILIQRLWRECGRDRQRLVARLGIEPHQLRYLAKKLDLQLG